MSKQEAWQPCPRCGSKKVTTLGKGSMALLGIIIISIFFWVMLFVPPVGIVGMIVGGAFLIVSPFARTVLTCQDCKKSWKFEETLGAD